MPLIILILTFLNIHNIDTEAKLVDFDEDSSDEAGGQQPSQLRKLTSLPLSEGDRRYAGKTSSRNQWLADSGMCMVYIRVRHNTLIYFKCSFRNVILIATCTIFESFT